MKARCRFVVVIKTKYAKTTVGPSARPDETLSVGLFLITRIRNSGQMTGVEFVKEGGWMHLNYYIYSLLALQQSGRIA
jgi:hypothetical protein